MSFYDARRTSCRTYGWFCRPGSSTAVCAPMGLAVSAVRRLNTLQSLCVGEWRRQLLGGMHASPAINDRRWEGKAGTQRYGARALRRCRTAPRNVKFEPRDQSPKLYLVAVC
jgi:hypothetical protein